MFVGLWSSAFVTAKVGVQYATPFAMLLTRFALVSCLFGSLFDRPLLAPHRPEDGRHGDHRPDGACRAAASWRLSGKRVLCSVGRSLGRTIGIDRVAATVACLRARHFSVWERLSAAQIVGMVAGISGVFLVLLPKMDGTMPMLGLLSVSIGLVAVTSGTLLQKKIGGKIDLLPSNVIQSLAASAFFVIICGTIETPRISWEMPFMLALGWQVIMVSAGAYVILMVMIRRDTMAAVSSLMFLVPPVTAVIAAVGFDEPLTPVSILGFCVTSAGVYLVTRYSSPGTP